MSRPEPGAVAPARPAAIPLPGAVDPEAANAPADTEPSASIESTVSEPVAADLAEPPGDVAAGTADESNDPAPQNSAAEASEPTDRFDERATDDSAADAHADPEDA